jgi:hypothetical protein
MNEPTLQTRPSRKRIVKAHPITQSEGPIRALGLRRDPKPAFRWSTLPAGLCSGDGELDDFQAALGNEGYLNFFLTGPGHFRAKLTQVKLRRLTRHAAGNQIGLDGYACVGCWRGRNPRPDQAGTSIAVFMPSRIVPSSSIRS